MNAALVKSTIVGRGKRGAAAVAAADQEPARPAKQKRVPKNGATTPAVDEGQRLPTEDEEREAALAVYGTAACFFDALCFGTLHEEEAMTILKTENPDVCESGLECRRCRSNKIYSRSLQIRGGDEGTTVFAVCSECNFSWREG